MSRRQNESEEEELKRLERNRVAFEAWLQRKNEQKKVLVTYCSTKAYL